MPPASRHTIRLPAALEAQVQGRIQAGTPFAALVREALSAYLADSPVARPDPAPPAARRDAEAGTTGTDSRLDNLPPDTDLASTLVVLQAQVAALLIRVELLEQRQTFSEDAAAQVAELTADTPRPSGNTRADLLEGIFAAPTAAPEPPATDRPVLPANRVLGKLCPRGHDYQGTGQSLLRLPARVCLACERERSKAKRQSKA
ncbi:MAG: hypothetical protein AB7N91_22860 [Candidatus Tectimicrobiota bacterium]